MTSLIRKPISWMSVLSAVSLFAGLSQAPACGDDDDTGTPTAVPGTPTPEAGTPTPTMAPTAYPEVTVSFQVVLVDADGNGLLDLNAVGETDDVYIVGGFTSWCPNFDGYQMGDMDDEDPSTYELTITFPHDGYEWSDPCGQAPKTFNPGDTLDFKFAKTTSDSANPWAEGQKDVSPIGDLECPNGEEGAVWGLTEVSNIQFPIPTATEANGDVVIAGPYEVEAWRETADAIEGVTECD